MLAILLDSAVVLALPWNILTVPVAEVLIAPLPADVIVMSLPAVVSPASRLEPALTVIEPLVPDAFRMLLALLNVTPPFALNLMPPEVPVFARVTAPSVKLPIEKMSIRLFVPLRLNALLIVKLSPDEILTLPVPLPTLAKMLLRE